jgi:hypothetical protein
MQTDTVQTDTCKSHGAGWAELFVCAEDTKRLRGASRRKSAVIDVIALLPATAIRFMEVFRTLC